MFDRRFLFSVALLFTTGCESPPSPQSLVTAPTHIGTSRVYQWSEAAEADTASLELTFTVEDVQLDNEASKLRLYIAATSLDLEPGLEVLLNGEKISVKMSVEGGLLLEDAFVNFFDDCAHVAVCAFDRDLQQHLRTRGYSFSTTNIKDFVHVGVNTLVIRPNTETKVSEEILLRMVVVSPMETLCTFPGARRTEGEGHHCGVTWTL